MTIAQFLVFPLLAFAVCSIEGSEHWRDQRSATLGAHGTFVIRSLRSRQLVSMLPELRDC